LDNDGIQSELQVENNKIPEKPTKPSFPTTHLNLEVVGDWRRISSSACTESLHNA